MAGSRKGERRGGAKPGRKRPSGGARKDPSLKISKVVSVLAPKGPRQRAPTVEREKQIHFLITGHSELLPRDAMLKAMRYFFEKAQHFLNVSQGLIATEPETPKQKEEQDQDIIAAEAQVERYFLMGSDIAYKVAPYIHPRLSAIAVAPANAESKDLFTLLLEEIDAQGRERRMRVIEHSGGNNGETMQ